MDQHAVEGKNVVIPIVEKFGFRHGSAILIAHELVNLMVDAGLIAYARSPKRAAAKAVKNSRGLDVIQSAGVGIGILREGNMPSRCRAGSNSIKTVRRFAAQFLLFVVHHTRRFSLPIISLV